MRQRLGRECLYVPSCRLGLYVALRHWCPPGGRVLMSPVNDDVLFFVVLAAGLRPVQAPLRADDASIDVDAVPASLWSGLSAVLTTNLYGNPDPAPELRARCDRLGIPLFEDAAHAIGSEIAGQPVGSFGDASVFSLSKHTGAKTGGFLAVADPALRGTLERARDELLQPTRLAAELTYGLRPYAEAGVRGLRLTGAARAALRLLGLEEREEIRMALRPGELKEAVTGAPALEDFNSWIRVDMHDYRLTPGGTRLRRIERLLRRLDTHLTACRTGTERLASSPWAPPRSGPVQPLFRVPLLVDDRTAAIAALARHRITTGYLYDPPLDDYAGEEFTDPSPSPQNAAYFARHALPVDPLRAEQVLSVLHRSGIGPAPAAPERSPGTSASEPSGPTGTADGSPAADEAGGAAGAAPHTGTAAGHPATQGETGG
ncbi:DegT/DnrJ/EryC1/StrS family aminotransferase [Streptomyces albipurpureus]|uniref:DegT/DnrJ/EryC1/StrS family aminotransferase n=1 Tax=Streptomyces albipurpureus TaxID=2897419 RepID=A0ABT0UPU5_9ACTN|nr:DegT/DnrJ/EryC1/StrS family aminotransferase [Streptomyces sp. CWNU-1]MCM2390110.1 DegT/DnrJ/EryC1/StrS family aminotransferase [Streptomyces sp. CWNU-1]